MASQENDNAKFKAFNPGSWKGGPCPVGAGTVVEVRLHNGRVLGPAKAESFGWNLDYTPDGSGWGIASYRVVSA